MVYYTWLVEMIGDEIPPNKALTAYGLLSSRAQAIEYIGAPKDLDGDIWITASTIYTLVVISNA